MLISDLKLLLRFNSTSLYEEVSQTNLSYVGGSTPIVDNSGYTMTEDQYLAGYGLSENGFNLEVSSALTMGFWLYSINSGIAVNEDSGTTSSVEKPLFDFLENGSSLNSVIKITEHTLENGNNYLKINFREGDYEASSEEYETSQWHYIWIVYRGLTLYLYIDGIEHTLQDESGSVPSSISTSNIYLYINHSVEGYAWNISKNTGIIDDIFILNIGDRNEQNIQRVINDGIKYFIDDDYTTTDIDKQNIYFNDPETITMNSLIDDMNYIFVGRNDGKIMRGSPLLWEVRRVFSDEKEIEDLGLNSDTDMDISKGFLKINNKTVRL